jgi:hypothetical protein
MTVRVPLSAATTVGVKAMRIVQLAPPASEFGLTGQVPPLCSWKSPLREMELMVSGIAWTFVRVSVFTALVVPSARFPNDKVAGEIVTGATPVPVRSTD